MDVVGKHASPFQLKDGSPAPGRAFRIVLGCYPIAAEKDKEWRGKDDPATEPGGWKDFFDAAAFPGRRAMYAQPMPNLEFALVSEGAPIDKLYPLDVDRAFKILERHKSLVNVWYKSTTQIPTLMRGEEVDLIAATNGRMTDLVKSGAPTEAARSESFSRVVAPTPLGGTFTTRVNAMSSFGLTIRCRYARTSLTSCRS